MKKKFKVLVLVEDYPNNNGNVALMYVHTRNLYYVEHGMDVTVLNFKTKENYNFQGINVFSMQGYKDSHEKYDLLIVHAANIKHHYLFLKKNEKRFEKIVFFYHGHEVLKINEVYSKPYDFIGNSKRKEVFQNLYDDFKLAVWRKYLPKICKKSFFIFVSKWMMEEFFRWTKISPELIKEKASITYNCVGKIFETGCYNPECEKKYDFITIRNNLDGSKYAIDLVNNWAKNTPQAKFLIVGKGNIFNHISKADNVDWIDETMAHQEILDALDISRYALMPTRTDAQGLMMCEMAAYGIPVITSDIPVCHEVFDEFPNAFFVKNNDSGSLQDFVGKKIPIMKDIRYYKANTLDNELRIINSIFEQ